MFYDAERVLSSITNFLVHLDGKERVGVKWEGRGKRRERGGKGRVWRAGMECTKK